VDYVKYSFIALVGWGIWAIGSKILTRYFNTLSTAFWISLWSILFLTALLVLRKNLVVNRFVLLSIPVGLISMLAIVAFYGALKSGPSSVVLPLTNLYVVLPVLFGFVVLKEPVTVARVLGVIFAVIAAVLLTL